MSGPSQKPWWRRWFGSRSERAAVRFLKQAGYRILFRNYTCPLGELDVIALDKRCVVFVEVRSTADEQSEQPAESVDENKQRQLSKLALYFLQKRNLLNHSSRFDVLTVHWPEQQRDPQIEHFVNAFEATM